MITLLRKLFVLLVAMVCYGVGFAQTHGDGLAAMQMENWDKAIKIYSDLTKKDPVDQAAWLTLGSAFLAKGDITKAREQFDAAFQAKAEGPYAMVANVRMLIFQNDQVKVDEAIRKASKYAKKDKNIAALRLLGESFLYNVPDAKRNFARTEELLKDAVDFNSKDFATLMALAYCYKEMPNGGLAAQHYEYAANIESKNPLPYYMLAKVYKAAKLNDKFMTYVDKAIALDPRFTPALRAKAEHLYFDRQWEKANQAAKDLVNNGAEVTIEDEMLLANLLYINKDCKACSDLVENILKKDGSKNYLRRLQAYCDYDNGDYKQGLQILEDFFKQVAPDKIKASDYEYLGKLQIKSGRDTLKALDNYKKSIEVDSSKWPLYKEMGDFLYQKKEYRKAAEMYEKHIDSLANPTPNDYHRLGITYYYSQDDTLRYVKAEKAFAKVTELKPDAGIGWSWRAKAMAKMEPDIVNHPELLEEFGKSKPFFEKFVEIAETDSANLAKNKKDLIAAYEYLASYYFLKNDDENAKKYLDKLSALDPENKVVKDIKLFMEGGTPMPTPTQNNGGGSRH